MPLTFAYLGLSGFFPYKMDMLWQPQDWPEYNEALWSVRLQVYLRRCTCHPKATPFTAEWGKANRRCWKDSQAASGWPDHLCLVGRMLADVGVHSIFTPYSLHTSSCRWWPLGRGDQENIHPFQPFSLLSPSSCTNGALWVALRLWAPLQPRELPSVPRLPSAPPVLLPFILFLSPSLTLFVEEQQGWKADV